MCPVLCAATRRIVTSKHFKRSLVPSELDIARHLPKHQPSHTHTFLVRLHTRLSDTSLEIDTRIVSFNGVAGKDLSYGLPVGLYQ